MTGNGHTCNENQYKFSTNIIGYSDSRRHKISQRVRAPQPRTGMARFKMAGAEENKLLAQLAVEEQDRLLLHLESVE